MQLVRRLYTSHPDAKAKWLAGDNIGTLVESESQKGVTAIDKAIDETNESESQKGVTAIDKAIDKVRCILGKGEHRLWLTYGI